MADEVAQWKPVRGYEGVYEVSNDGRVRSVQRRVVYSDGRSREYPSIELTQLNRGKYLGVAMSVGSRVKSVDVHRLVADAFCERKDGGVVVNHLDKDCHNNRSVNLEWTTVVGNVRHSCAKVSQDDVRAIRSIKAFKYGERTAIAKRLGVKPSTVGNIRRGINWSDISIAK